LRSESTPFVVKRLDHVQVAIPEGGEVRAEAFYSGILGLEILPKPPSLAARGGRWFGRDGIERRQSTP
jgi:hypothetical protein